LDLVCAIAFLHQHQRRNGQAHGIDFVEASPEDYELAARLMQYCLGCAFDDLSPRGRELYTCVQQRLRDRPQSTMTRRDICHWTGWKLGQVRRELPELIELGYLRKLTGSQGQEYLYRLVESPQGTPSWRLGALSVGEEAANGPGVGAERSGRNGQHPDAHDDIPKESLGQAHNSKA
jgi:hypothetical protein